MKFGARLGALRRTSVEPAVPSPRLFRFETFDVDVRTGELRKAGVKLKLPGQPFQVLAILLESPGEVVTREELQKRLWPDTFADVDHNLNTAINKIREVLGDSAESPRFVETLPRRGYRFIGPVTPVHADRPPPAPSSHVRRYVTVGATFLFLLALSGAAFLKWRFARRAAIPGTIRSLAVLPLANLSADPSQQYLVDGMTEELTSEISQLHSLRVISRTSSMQYRDTHKDAPQIAKELHADGLIEGSILRVNDRVRVTATLIHVASDTHLWSKRYERDLRDVIALQHEIASDIAREVRITL